MSDIDSAHLIFYLILAVLIGAGILRASRTTQQWNAVFRYAIYWILIVVFLIAIYVFRFDFAYIANRMLSGLLPGAVFSELNDGQVVVSVVKSANDHFEVNGEINGHKIRFLIDTGATPIVLSYNSAQQVGINVAQLIFNTPTSTANGISYSAFARIDNLKIGDIKRQNVAVLVAQQNALFTNLLGQDFLESLTSYERQGDRLILRD